MSFYTELIQKLKEITGSEAEISLEDVGSKFYSNILLSLDLIKAQQIEGGGGGGTVSQEEIEQIVNDFLTNNQQDNSIIYECGNSTLEEEILSDFILFDCGTSI